MLIATRNAMQWIAKCTFLFLFFVRLRLWVVLYFSRSKNATNLLYTPAWWQKFTFRSMNWYLRWKNNTFYYHWTTWITVRLRILCILRPMGKLPRRNYNWIFIKCLNEITIEWIIQCSEWAIKCELFYPQMQCLAPPSILRDWRWKPFKATS